jgi:hypothetical protein
MSTTAAGLLGHDRRRVTRRKDPATPSVMPSPRLS